MNGLFGSSHGPGERDLAEKCASAMAGEAATLCAPPRRQFFMTLRDIGMWVRSARADAAVAEHTAEHGVSHAFEMLYVANPDPYGAIDPRYRYQARKYETLLSFLPARRYRHILELGCGVGALCRALASHAESVTGVDIAAAAVQRATNLSQNHCNVTFVSADVRTFGTADAAGRRYDLIVIADVLYYALQRDDKPALEAIACRVAACLAPGGLVLLADHYFFGLDAASRRTRAIHRDFRQASMLHQRAEHRRCFYLATLLEQK
jgi:2-polyprenyl-3-methyl-5-hydroxy-6-metoxy-1,4-benzoquinol methylase